MEELLKQMENRLKQLEIGLEKQIANIHAQEGAIQECKQWIETLKVIKSGEGDNLCMVK